MVEPMYRFVCHQTGQMILGGAVTRQNAAFLMTMALPGEPDLDDLQVGDVQQRITTTPDGRMQGTRRTYRVERTR